MKYFLGVDAGGTKTQCYVGDETGKVLGEGLGGPGNYQTSSIEKTKASILKSMNAAFEASGLAINDISYAVFGLAGADEQVDFDLLLPMCKEIMADIPHAVVNDTWIGLRTGSEYGVISICGTGAAHAGKNKVGERIILRNLSYTLGNLGGGNDVVNSALHYAFRSSEGSYTKSRLEEIMPSIFDVESMDQVSALIRDNDDQVPSEMAYKIPIETMRLATEGDEVAHKIIFDMGREEGRYAAGIIRRLGIEREAVPLVLIGSMFKTGNSILTKPYLDEARKAAANAYIIIPSDPPVTGALKLAIDTIR